jgi:hypothetical protein
MFSYAAVTRTLNALLLAPFAKGITVKLRTSIADNVSRSFLGIRDGSSQETANSSAIGLLRERRHAHHFPGEMVDDQCYPICEGPLLRQRKGGFLVSDNTVREVCQQESRGMANWQRNALAAHAPFRQAGGDIEFSTDGTSVTTRLVAQCGYR